jgi:hypothetical protein
MFYSMVFYQMNALYLFIIMGNKFILLHTGLNTGSSLSIRRILLRSFTIIKPNQIEH